MYSRVLLAPALTLATLPLALPSRALAAPTAGAVADDADDDDEVDELATATPVLAAAALLLPELSITTPEVAALTEPVTEAAFPADGHTPVMLPDDELPPGLPVEDKM